MSIPAFGNTSEDRWNLAAETAFRSEDRRRRDAMRKAQGAGGPQGGLQGGGYRPGPSMSDVRSGSAELARGHKGEAVKQLQTELNSRGARLAVDGKFGPRTESALRDFQQRSNLEANGRLNVDTSRALADQATAARRNDSFTRVSPGTEADPRGSDPDRQPSPRAPSIGERRPAGTRPASDLMRADEDARGVRRADSTAGNTTAPAPGLASWNGAPVNQQMANRVRDPAIVSEIDRQARARGIDPTVARAIVGIESGGDPNARTGSYKGLFQLSDSEFRRYGNGGNIYNPRDNINAGLNSLQAKATDFERRNGRPPTPTELYLAHQQGPGGLQRHLGNPDGSAVQNMLNTGEGRQRGLRWARAAVWGNVPSDMRHLFPNGPDSITSRQFAAVWAQKLQGIPYEQSIRSTAPVFGAYGPARAR